MRKTLTTLGLTLAFLLAIDVAVAGLLGWADRQGRFGSLVRYFEYGRSVPGKLTLWDTHPDSPGNLYDVAWRDEAMARSAAEFAAEPPGTGPVVRSYGMSFVNNVLDQARALDPTLVVDGHAGPGAPPNSTYAMFIDDRQSRRPSDIAVLGILSSSVPAMAALSNQTWVFEQPAPFTYPVFHPDGEGLRWVVPLVTSAAQHRSLDENPDMARSWARQLAGQDAFYSPITHGAVWADRSPFARLVRRSLATGHIERAERRILENGRYPYVEVLQRMIADFAATARADGQMPVVMLIQSSDLSDPDVLEIARPVLERDAIAYLATVEHADPRDPAGFLTDGHYAPEFDRRFGRAFLDVIAAAM